MNNKNEEKLQFRPNGSFVEFTKGDKPYLGYLLRRFLAMLIDLTFFVIMFWLLAIVMKLHWLMSALFIMIGLNVYIFTSSMMLGNRTIGLYLTKLTIVNYDGSELNKSNRMSKLMFRSTIWSFIIVCVPIACLYLVCCFIMAMVGRTTFVVDRILKMQIITSHASKRYTRIMKEWNDEKRTRSI